MPTDWMGKARALRAQDQPKTSSSTVKLHYVELCENEMGIWTQRWFLTLEEARQCFRELKKKGFSTKIEGGEYGSLLSPGIVEVETTPEGVLAFANEWAVDRSA